MSSLKAVCVYDSKVAGFGVPMFYEHVGLALRDFEEFCNDGKSPMSKYPADFSLFEVGEFDRQSGALVSHEKPRNLGMAAAFKKQSSPLQGALPMTGLDGPVSQ